MEGVSVYTTGRLALSKVRLVRKCSTRVTKNSKFPVKIKSQVQFVLFCSSAASSIECLLFAVACARDPDIIGPSYVDPPGEALQHRHRMKAPRVFSQAQFELSGRTRLQFPRNASPGGSEAGPVPQMALRGITINREIIYPP
jgi:hypothetical protein